MRTLAAGSSKRGLATWKLRACSESRSIAASEVMSPAAGFGSTRSSSLRPSWGTRSRVAPDSARADLPEVRKCNGRSRAKARDAPLPPRCALGESAPEGASHGKPQGLPASSAPFLSGGPGRRREVLRRFLSSVPSQPAPPYPPAKPRLPASSPPRGVGRRNGSWRSRSREHPGEAPGDMLIRSGSDGRCPGHRRKEGPA